MLRGFVLGFAIAATPGPIFFLCLKRTLTQGWLKGVVSGLGVATADGLYCAIAAFGVTAASAVLVGEKRWLELIGGAALVVLGVRGLLGRSAANDVSNRQVGSRAAAYISTLGLTIANPATVVSFAAVSAALGVGLGGGYLAPSALAAGVLLGSASSGFALASSVAVMRGRVSPEGVRIVSTASAIMFLGFGLAAVLAFFGGG